MKILVTGRDGQLARSLAALAHHKPLWEFFFIARPDLDLEICGSAARAISAIKPDLVVNAAAYTNVDLAESESRRAFQINGLGAGEVAAAAAQVGAAVVQISTDYVFDGGSIRAYREDDDVGPINVYGASKLAGEQAVQEANPRHLILRTSWVYSPYGQNFLATMLRLAAQRDQINVVADQIGCPTSALDLARAIVQMIDEGLEGLVGPLHIAGNGRVSWADLAEQAMRASSKLGGPSAKICKISTAEWPTAAKRPAYSVLDCTRFETRFGARPEWRASVSETVGRLLS